MFYTVLSASKNRLVLFLVLCLSGCLNHAKYSSFESSNERLIQKDADTEIKVKLSVANPKYYLVKPGDTLYSIAFRFGLDYMRLAASNKIGPSFRIFEGQSLSLSEADGEAKINQNPSAATAVNSSVITSSSVTKVNSQNNGDDSSVKRTVDLPELSWNWPHLGKIVRTFRSGSSTQKGIDIKGQIGDSVVAATSGIVVYAGNGLPGYGNLIIVEHANSLLSAYAFAETILVKEKDNISAGQKIATMGEQGDQPGLHFEIRQNGKPVDPFKFLPKR